MDGEASVRLGLGVGVSGDDDTRGAEVVERTSGGVGGGCKCGIEPSWAVSSGLGSEL